MGEGLSHVLIIPPIEPQNGLLAEVMLVFCTIARDIEVFMHEKYIKEFFFKVTYNL